MNINRFLKQEVEWQPRTGQSGWGEGTYGPVQVLPARREEKQNMVRSESGVELLSSATILLAREVNVGDLIDNQEIQARENYVSRNGTVVGWRAFL